MNNFILKFTKGIFKFGVCFWFNSRFWNVSEGWCPYKLVDQSFSD